MEGLMSPVRKKLNNNNTTKCVKDFDIFHQPFQLLIKKKFDPEAVE